MHAKKGKTIILSVVPIENTKKTVYKRKSRQIIIIFFLQMQLCKISSSEWLRQDFQVIHCPNGMQMILPRRRSSPDLQAGNCQAKWQDRCYCWLILWCFKRCLWSYHQAQCANDTVVGIGTKHENLQHTKKTNYQIFVVTTTGFELLKSPGIAVLPGISADLCRLVSLSVPWLSSLKELPRQMPCYCLSEWLQKNSID